MASITPHHAFDSVSVAAGGTETSAWLSAYDTNALRLVVASAGADITVDIEGTPDGGSTTYTIASGLTAGADQIRDAAENKVRLSASNAGTSAQTVDAYLLLRG